MNIQLIQIPYDSGQRELRTGRGPGHFLQHGVEQILRENGHQVTSQRLESKASFTTEIGTAIELNRSLAEQIRSTQGKTFPIVLAGNCNSCLGTIAGIGQSQLGVLWFDAHGDFNTPETTRSGFFDGMGLAMATGRCWGSLLGTIPGFHPVPEANIIHIGARDLDPEEERLLQQSEIQVIPPRNEAGSLHETVEAALDKLKGQVARVYVHMDLDVLDTGEALPNHLAVPGGLSVEAVEEIIELTKKRFEVCAGTITCFDPSYDKGDEVLKAGIRIMNALLA